MTMTNSLEPAPYADANLLEAFFLPNHFCIPLYISGTNVHYQNWEVYHVPGAHGKDHIAHGKAFAGGRPRQS